MAESVPMGIEVRHRRSCGTHAGGVCTCKPGYRATVTLPSTRRKAQRTFPTIRAAVQWREDARVDARRGTLGSKRSLRLRDVASTWSEGAADGTIRNRSGDLYKPSALRGYDQALRDRVLPALGGYKLAELSRADVQRLVDDLVKSGASASTVRNALLPLRAIC